MIYRESCPESCDSVLIGLELLSCHGVVLNA